MPRGKRNDFEMIEGEEKLRARNQSHAKTGKN